MRQKWHSRNSEFTLNRPKIKFQDDKCSVGLESNQGEENVSPQKGRLQENKRGKNLLNEIYLVEDKSIDFNSLK